MKGGRQVSLSLLCDLQIDREEKKHDVPANGKITLTLREKLKGCDGKISNYPDTVNT